MRYKNIRTGEIFLPKSIKIKGIQYPASIFTSWPIGRLEGLGIYPFREEKFDQEIYESTGFTDVIAAGEVVRQHTVKEKMSIGEFRDKLKKKIDTEVAFINWQKNHFDDQATRIVLADSLKTNLDSITDYKELIDLSKLNNGYLLYQSPSGIPSAADFSIALKN